MLRKGWTQFRPGFSVHNLACVTGVCGCRAHNGFLTRKGYEELDKAAQSSYLDKVGSVSELAAGRHVSTWLSEEETDEQHRRFLNGS